MSLTLSRSRSYRRSRSVRRSRSRNNRYQRSPSPQYVRNKCFVGNLEPLTDEFDLEAKFARYGTMEDIFIPRDRTNRCNKGFAFVTFTDERDAKDACQEDGLELRGARVRVNLAKPRPGGEAVRGKVKTYVPSRDGLIGSLREFTGRGKTRSRSYDRARYRSRSRNRSSSRRRRYR